MSAASLAHIFLLSQGHATTIYVCRCMPMGVCICVMHGVNFKLFAIA